MMGALLQLEDDRARRFPGPTPRPWKRGDMGSLVADMEPRNECERAYGGPPVCESMREVDADFVLALIASHDRLVAVARETQEALMRFIDRGSGTVEFNTAIAYRLSHSLFSAILQAPK